MEKPPSLIAGLSHAAIRTRNILETVRFYTDVLGLPEAFRMCNEDGAPVTVYLFIAPGQYLELFANGLREPDAGKDMIGLCHLCLETKDAEAAYALVQARGGPIDTPVYTGKSLCRMFWTHDPDGTPIEIMAMPPESLQAQADKRLAGKA